jgi:hypothetical protein
MDLLPSNGQVEHLLPALLPFDTLEQLCELNLPFLEPVETFTEICRQKMGKEAKKNPMEGILLTWTAKELASCC